MQHRGHRREVARLVVPGLSAFHQNPRAQLVLTVGLRCLQLVLGPNRQSAERSTQGREMKRRYYLGAWVSGKLCLGECMQVRGLKCAILKHRSRPPGEGLHSLSRPFVCVTLPELSHFCLTDIWLSWRNEVYLLPYSGSALRELGQRCGLYRWFVWRNQQIHLSR